jgi:hypothetical protein
MNEEQQELLEQAPPAEAIPDFLSASYTRPGVIETELLLDGRRVVGEIRLPGEARRLIDILNARESGYIKMHSGELVERSGNPLKFDTMQLARTSILVAFPHRGSASRIHPGEVIEKDRRLVTVIMPGCQVSGYFHVAHGVDPSIAAAGLGNRFVALTDATITVIGNDTPTRFEPVALVNISHAEAYVWSDAAGSKSSEPANAQAEVTHEATKPADSIISSDG